MMRRGPALAVWLACAAPGLLAAQPNPGGHWVTLETAHFHVHVRAEEREFGRAAAAAAESVYAALAAELPPPSATIELVVADNSDVTNGAASVYPFPAALVYAVPPVADIELGDYDRWLQLGLAHELAHVFDLDLARGWWRLARGVFGRLPGLFPNLYAPDWLIEGIAVYYESRLTSGGRLRGSYYRAILAAQDGEAGALPVDAASGLGPRWPAGVRPYAFGARFLDHVAATAGDSAVPRLIRETARRPIPYLGLSGALRPAAGTSILAAWSAWQDSLAGGAARAPASPAPGVTVLGGLRAAVAPRVSPDGRSILFVLDDGKDARRLAVLERGSGRVRPLARLNGEVGVAWDAGGGAIVSQLELSDPYTSRSDLWRVTADGAEQRLTWGSRLKDPDAAPPQGVVATRVILGGTELVRRDTAGLQVLTAREPGVEWAQPRVAPDGRTIAAVRAREGRRSIVLLSRSGEVVREVTRGAAVDRTPAFSPDGRWLFWSSDRSGLSQLYATRADTAVDQWWCVSGEPFGAYGPAPASDSIFYLAYRHDGFSLTAVAFDTTRWVPVASMQAPGDTAAAAPLAASPAIRSEHSYRAWPSLLPRYWLPLVQSGAGVGVGVGAGATWIGLLTSGEDALGAHAYGATVSLGIGAAAGTWRGAVGYTFAGLVPWLLDASYSRHLLVVDTLSGPGVQAVCCRVDENASVGVTWRHPRWRTQLASRAGAEYERSGGLGRAGPVVSFSASHLTQPPFAISLQDGWWLSATGRQRWRTGGGAEYHEATARASVYRTLPVRGFAHPVVAARASVGLLGGSDRVVYGVGGVSEGGVELSPGLSVGGGERTFPVRGYGGGAVLGRGAATASVELRAPLALVGRGLGLLPLYLDRLSVALFADGGATWTPASFSTQLPRSASIGSVGAEFCVDLGAVNEVPLRLRVGAARPLTGRASMTAYVALGPSF